MSSPSVMAMQPEPVQMSRMRMALSSFSPSVIPLFSAASFSIHSQSSAVSGLGISTPGSTWKVLPAKSASPSTYCTGSPFCSLLIISSSFFSSSADNSLTLPQIMSVSVIPYLTSSMVRTIACASPASYRGVRDCQSC